MEKKNEKFLNNLDSMVKQVHSVLIKLFISTADIQRPESEVNFELQQGLDVKQEFLTERPFKKAKMERKHEAEFERVIHPTSAYFATGFLSNFDHERTMRILLRLFPEKKRSLLEVVVREYKGNLVEVLEFLVSNQEGLRALPPLINVSNQIPFPPPFFPPNSNLKVFPYFPF